MAQRFRLADRVTDENARWWALVAACFALFMAILDNLVVNIALPTMSREFSATPTELQWIVSAYTLIFASLQITAGGLGDRLGRKRWFLGGIALFTATSFIAAFSQNAETLIAMRALQGLGAAFIMPLSLSLISEAFPPEERGRALGIWSAVSVSGLALGPIVGGVLVEYASWNWVFLINVPIGIGAFFVTSAVVRESRDTSGTVATDVPGTVLITASIAALTWGLIEASERGWGDSLILASFVAAAALLVAFIRVELRTERPMVPLRFFRSTTFTGANIDAFAVSFLISGVAFFMTLYQQNVHGYSAIKTGMAMVPMVLVMMVGAPISGILINRTGPSKLISFGMVVAGIGMLLYLRADVGATYLDILPGYLVMGLGMSFIFAPMTTAVLNSVESAKSGVASAINGALREIGTAFGIALLGTLMNRAYKSSFNADDRVDALRADPANGPLAGVVDLIGSGMNYGGRVIEDPRISTGVPGQIVGQLRAASGEAFIRGMDVAIYVSAAGIFVAALVSLWLIRDNVAAREKVPETLEEAEALAQAAD